MDSLTFFKSPKIAPPTSASESSSVLCLRSRLVLGSSHPRSSPLPSRNGACAPWRKCGMRSNECNPPISASGSNPPNGRANCSRWSLLSMVCSIVSKIHSPGYVSSPPSWLTNYERQLETCSVKRKLLSLVSAVQRNIAQSSNRLQPSANVFPESLIISYFSPARNPPN